MELRIFFYIPLRFKTIQNRMHIAYETGVVKTLVAADSLSVQAKKKST